MHNSKINLPANFNNLSNLLVDYLKGEEKVNEFVHFFNTPKDWDNMLSTKAFSEEKRKSLVQNLNEQYTRFNIHEAVKQNIELLNEPNAYTVTTGHQLCLLTGPLFFIYKIATTIKLAQEFKKNYPDKNFVPFYWLASEDHDFAEINHAYLFGKKITWEREAKGPVGQLTLETISPFIEKVKEILGTSENAESLNNLICKAYSYNTLSEATLYLVNELFGKYGLVCLDANHQNLKKEFVPVLEKELSEQFSNSAVTLSNGLLLKKGYQPIVESKPINLFYVDDNIRERIEYTDQNFIVRNTDIKFTKHEIISLVKSNPEKFSPNVILRPLYQETILPNLAYVGGPSEIAYWMQFKKVFEAAELKMPVLVYRNSFYLIDKMMFEQWKEMGFNIEDFKKDEKELIKQYLDNQNLIPISFEKHINQLITVIEDIKKEAVLIDKTLINSINAEEQKFKNALLNIESKLNKVTRNKFDKQLNIIKRNKEKLFPAGSQQERVENLFPYLLKYPDFIEIIMQNIDFNSADSKLLCLE